MTTKGNSLLDMNLTDVPEQEILGEDEYKLRIVKSEKRIGKTSDAPYLNVALGATEHPDAKLINHMMMIPTTNDDDGVLKMRLRGIKNFCLGFGIDAERPLAAIITECEENGWVGNEGWVIVKVETSDEYDDQNRIKKFIKSG